MRLIGHWTLAVLCLAAGVPAPAPAAAPARERAPDLRGKWSTRMPTFFEHRQHESGQGWIGSWPAIEWPDTSEGRAGFRTVGTTDVVLEFGHGTLALVRGAVIGQGREERRRATYKVTRSDASTVWLKVTSKRKDGSVSVSTMSARFEDRDTVRLTREGESTGLLLTRVK